MRRNLIFAVFIAAFAAPAFAADLKCRAADEGNRNRKDVEVTVVTGAEVVTPKVTKYAGYDVTVVYQTGDEFDPQTRLTLNADDVTAQTYNVSQKGLYQLHAPRLFLQCWFE